ncbi:MAG: helix-turn-helix transcriptional regulator [Leptolyngbya sp. SIO1E4]|nr:helix-turn-helix transcriptional regulator [Leptolyngbya sp. SIO1E4]
MSLNLTAQEVDNIWAEAEQHCPPITSSDGLETICTTPLHLGSGYRREIELCPGLELTIFNETYPNSLTYLGMEDRHPVQFMVHLSGVINSGGFLHQDATQSYVGGSGIQQAIDSFCPGEQTQIGINIHLQPHLFKQFFSTPTGELPSEYHLLVKGDDWQQRFSPKTTGTMRSVVQQIIDCPLLGAAKRLYLQGKVFELMALQLDALLSHGHPAAPGSLKPDVVTRIHYAAEILRSRLENPPSQTELAQQVGIGHCTLNKGFREIFEMTPFAYLTRYRMEQAEQLLRQPGCTVTEVANQVGYGNPAKFAVAFKRRFGITPRECMRGTISR